MEKVWQRVVEFNVGRLGIVINHDVLRVDFVGYDAHGPMTFSWQIGAEEMRQVRAIFEHPSPDPPPSIGDYFAELERRVASLEEGD